MKNIENNLEVIKYTLAGVIFGIIYPFLSTFIELIEFDLPLNLSNFLYVQQQNPLLWIMDSALLVLGFFGYQVGVRQQKLIFQAANLERLVNERSEEILRQKLFYEALVENSPIAIVTLDQKHQVVSINPAFQGIFGYRSDEIMGKNLDDLVSDPDNKHEAIKITKGVMAGKTMHEYGKRRRKDGTLVDMEILGEPININGKRIGVLGLYRDVTLEKQAREELQTSEKRFRRMFEDSPIALLLEDCSKLKRWALEVQESSGVGIREYLEDHPQEFSNVCKLREIISLNSASLFLFRAKDKADLQANLCQILTDESRETLIDIICAFLDGETTLEREMVYKSLDDKKIYAITKLSILPGFEDSWNMVLFSNMDITERKLSEDRLSYISLHDMTTGVYNRAFYEEEMTRMESGRLRPISILVGDIDDLKKINDEYGHQAGDVALQLIANILKDCIRSEDVVARIGGDEFSILLPNVNEDFAQQVKQRILDQIGAHNQSKNEAFPISLSIGCGILNKGDLFSDVFKQADARMYQEKQEKKNNIK
ncbi:MAG: GGDEF domain-containing protein [Pelolinea sp.]|nr:GGDEF domain-containing protein [Pelolinea sp.]